MTTPARREQPWHRIPSELRDLPQWVGWRFKAVKNANGEGGWTKVPINVATRYEASSTDPETWATFGEAVDAVKRLKLAGIGFVFSKSDPYTGVDLDHCRSEETGEVEAWAQEIIDTLDSYTEASPSGAGVHVIVRATKPGDKCKRSNLGPHSKGALELYDHDRFFCFTGSVL